MNHNYPHSPYPTPQQEFNEWGEQLAPTIDLSNPGEGESFDVAKVREYANDVMYMTWDTPGQQVELAPVPRAGTREGWCTAESEYGVMMPDLFDVNSGDRQSAVAITTALGNLLILQDGKLYALRGSQIVAERDLREYFTAENPVIGGTWVIPRRDGGEPVQIKDIRSISIELTPRLEIFSNSIQNFPPYVSRSRSSGVPAIKMKSNGLRQHEANKTR